MSTRPSDPVAGAEPAGRTAAPTGTVTFLFTDIEGSTTRWEADRDAMAKAVARHDEMLTQVLADHGGHVFSTAGDSFAAAFGRVGDAINAAVTVQRCLAAEPWPDGADIAVRIGVHTGEADERGGDYFGPAVNRAARVMEAGHGGQVLLSDVSASLADDVRTIDLGAHLLKGMDEPVPLHQLLHPDLRQDFDPIRSAGTRASTLPHTTGQLVGREGELAKVEGLLAGHRIVTLTGTGGCGKTRLAIEAGRRRVATTPGGVCFADLSPVSDDDQVAATIAGAISALLTDRGDHVEQLVRAVGDRHMVLVVDNCEHVVDRAAEVVETLVASCPRLTVLATSREALEIDGERSMRVASLEADSAAALFVERAGEAIATPPSEADATAIAEICERLDGLPLAIELAAARTGVVPVAEIVDHLGDRFRFLTGGRRRTRGRQQTLLATVEWSYDLLDEAEQRALRALSVMPSSFGLTLAAGTMGMSEAAALDVLTSLCAQSLVQPTPEASSPHDRYRLLETIRVFADERLRQAGEADDVRRRHAETVAGMCPREWPALASVADSHFGDDLLVATGWARAAGDRRLASEICKVAADVLVARGDRGASVELFEWVAGIDDPDVQARCWMAAAYHCFWALQLDGAPGYAQRCIDAAPDSMWAQQARIARAVVFAPFLDQPVEEDLDRATAFFEQHDPGDWAVFEFWARGQRALWMEQDELAVEHDARALAEAVSAGFWQGNGRVNLLHDLAMVGDHVRLAEVLAEPAPAPTAVLDVALAESHRLTDGMGTAVLGRVAEGRRMIAESWEASRRSVVPGVDGHAAVTLAVCAMVAGEPDAARALLDDTAFICRQSSPTAHMYRLLAELHDVPPTERIQWRADELLRRAALATEIEREQRASKAVDAELARLGLR